MLSAPVVAASCRLHLLLAHCGTNLSSQHPLGKGHTIAAILDIAQQWEWRVSLSCWRDCSEIYRYIWTDSHIYGNQECDSVSYVIPSSLGVILSATFGERPHQSQRHRLLSQGDLWQNTRSELGPVCMDISLGSIRDSNTRPTCIMATIGKYVTRKCAI